MKAHLSAVPSRALYRLTLLLAGSCIHGVGMAQVVYGTGSASLTLEAYGNLSGGGGQAGPEEPLFFDGAVRALGLLPFGNQGHFGLRAVVEAQAGIDSGVDVGERSVIWLDRWGRFEYGRRQGLPDILIGYGPNNFTFTSAEYGPASGFSLDPAGGLTSVLLGPAGQAAQTLSHLGFAAALSNDRSEKVIYVSPKWAGFLGGLSYASDAGDSDDRIGALVQAGLTHETYAGEDVLRYGGSVSRARVDGTADLRSLNAGFSALLRDTWLIGVSAGYDSGGGDFSSAWGVVSSLNYNRGAWTFGGFLQFATADTIAAGAAEERLRVGQLGLSYRTSRQTRWFAAYERRRSDDRFSRDGDTGVLVLGLRAII